MTKGLTCALTRVCYHHRNWRALDLRDQVGQGLLGRWRLACARHRVGVGELHRLLHGHRQSDRARRWHSRGDGRGNILGLGLSRGCECSENRGAGLSCSCGLGYGHVLLLGDSLSVLSRFISR
jgi:hypothetical protein